MEILYYIATSTTVTGLIVWFIKLRIEHNFKRTLENEKLEYQAQLKSNVDAYLGDLSAERNYLYEAKKRIYISLSPLRFQLIIACRDISGRILRHGIGYQYPFDTKHYYGQSTLYRLLKPLAILEMVEGKIAFTDFSVDEMALGLLKVRTALLRSLSTSTVILNHPNANWDSEIEHIGFDNISKVAQLLVKKGSEGESLLTFGEFQNKIKKTPEFFEPFISIFDDFSFESKAIFWIRLVTFGYLCSEYAKQSAKSIGLEMETYQTKELLRKVNDDYVVNNLDDYLLAIQKMVNEKVL